MSNIIHKLSYISGISYKQAQNILEEISKAALQNATKNTKLYILSKLPYDILKNIQDEKNQIINVHHKFDYEQIYNHVNNKIKFEKSVNPEIVVLDAINIFEENMKLDNLFSVI